MAQAEPILGRSILTPKSRIVKIPVGNYWPVERDPIPGKVQTAKQYVAPTAYMTRPQTMPNAAQHPPSYVGKGKEKALAETLAIPTQDSNGADSLASPPSERAESPVLDDDLDPTIAAAMRYRDMHYQEQVDKLEKERDREDSTYPEPTPEPEDPTAAGRMNKTRNTPRTRSRAYADVGRFDTRRVSQSETDRPVRQPAEQSTRKAKRQCAAAGMTAATTAPAPKRQHYTAKVHHNNQSFASLKPDSKLRTRRTDALKEIKSSWKISDAKLMELPYAPRRTTERSQPVIKPLDWNAPLLEAVAKLAELTSRDFTRSCTLVKEAFESESSSNGATQLNSKIVAAAIEKLQNVRPRHEKGHYCVQDKSTNGAPAQSVPRPDQQRPAEGEHKKGNAPNKPAREPATQASTSSNTAHTPLSPGASPVSAHTAIPVKVEQAVSRAQAGPHESSSQSSGSEDRLEWESKQRILELELAILREKLANDDRKRREKERKAARMRQHGGSAGDALLV